MKHLLYYQPDFERFHEVCLTWSERCINLKYEKPFLTNVEVISFQKLFFPFKGRPGELSTYLGGYHGELSSLIIVIGDLKKEVSEAIESELYTLFLLYPEVGFFFENNTVVPESIRNQVNLFLVSSRTDTIKKADIETFILTDNLFDASNLRAATKTWKQAQLKIENNFGLWEHRKKTLALVIDEEGDQCLHNCYILYANGFRSLPISSFRQVKEFCSINNKDISYDLIIRDFDLQFPDEIPATYWVIRENGETIPVSTIDFVRGFKWDNNRNEWIELIRDNLKIAERVPGIPRSEEEKALSNDEVNKLFIWNNDDYTKGKVRIITQGYNHLSIDATRDYFELIGNKMLVGPGLKKPIEGVYFDLQRINRIYEEFWESHKDSSKDKEAPNRERKENNHSEPLGLYEIAFVLTERAKKYYDNKSYLLAAVLSQEAIEILNGFHMMLTIRALHLHAISENAIAMCVIGGNETDLAEDSKLRARLIKEDVHRLVKGTALNPENILNQIFSDCRFFCKEKEHFASEEIFISEMAHLNEGGSIFTWFKNIGRHLSYGKRK